MAGAKAAAATPAKAAVRPAVAPAAEPAAGQAVGSAVKPAAAAAAAVAAADDKTHMIHAPAAPAAAGSAATPATAKPAAVEVAAAARPAAPTAPTAPSLPVVAPVAVDKPAARPASVTALAKLDANACAQAETQLKDDAWALGALGNRALCLIDQQKYPEAKNRIDQLAAFSPEDWRVELGRGALAAQKGDASQAEISYRNAAQLAPDEATRTAIKQMLAKLAGPAVN
jgi:tetratricopeptide (TPR) repeat protein